MVDSRRWGGGLRRLGQFGLSHETVHPATANPARVSGQSVKLDAFFGIPRLTQALCKCGRTIAVVIGPIRAVRQRRPDLLQNRSASGIRSATSM